VGGGQDAGLRDDAAGADVGLVVANGGGPGVLPLLDVLAAQNATLGRGLRREDQAED